MPNDKMKGFKVLVRTGDVRGGGSVTRLWITLLGPGNLRSERVRLSSPLKSNFRRGREEEFRLTRKESRCVTEVTAIELERDGSDDWFVDSILVSPYTDTGSQLPPPVYVFPLHLWVAPNECHVIQHLATTLPQNDLCPQDRARYLQWNRERYRPTSTKEGIVVSNFRRGREEEFRLTRKESRCVTEVTAIELERDGSDDWFVDSILVSPYTDTGSQLPPPVYVFPLHLWVAPNECHVIQHLATTLPQNDLCPQDRARYLQWNRERYRPTSTKEGIVVCEKLPPEEEFSDKALADLQSMKRILYLKSRLQYLRSGRCKYETFEEMKQLFNASDFPLPEISKLFKEDWYFGYQRLNGVNPISLELCLSVPLNLAVTDAMLSPLLEGLTTEQAIMQQRLFVVDFKSLKGIPCKTPDLTVCAPIALFFLTTDKKLMPVAIQLFQTPGEDNPVFLPTDDKHTWLSAKMWFNNADATLHQAIVHLAFTHLVMESFALAAKRQMSPLHPLTKLLAPHFFYILAINELARDKLVCPGGWVDLTLSIGSQGTLDLAGKALSEWRLDLDGTLPAQLKKRGVFDPDVLPGYHYRDDALLLYDAIRSYVSDYVTLYYESEEELQRDKELQNWVDELTRHRLDGGMGVQGIPGGGRMTSQDGLVLVLTCIIFTCSVQHAAVNFGQYDTYSFPPHQPASILGRPPTSKAPMTESQLIDSMPGKLVICDIFIVTRLLSERATKPLGDFDINYIADPRAEAIAQRFRDKLAQISGAIQDRNRDRYPIYDILDPALVPNSIAI